MARKAIGKKIRFEVFKRDGFTCQYCGATPPQAILHVDHIIAVASGGENCMDNYVTACQACNIGKGARSLKAIPQSLKDKALDIAEREAQLLGYQAIIQAKHDRILEESWQVCEVLKPGCSESGFGVRDLQSVGRFVDKLGLFEVLDAAQIATLKYRLPPKKMFLYFCGVCWNKIRLQEAENG